jgi:hypothetical protein
MSETINFIIKNPFILYFSIFFCILQLSCREILSMSFPKWWETLKNKKKLEIVTNVAALFHHLCIVPIGLYYHYRVLFGDGQYIPRDYYQIMSSFIIGYFIADSLSYAIPEAWFNRKYEFLFHHFLGIWINAAVAAQHQKITPDLLFFSTSCIIAEVSSIFFITGSFLRCIPSYSESKWIEYLNYLFAISFFLTRNVNLTIHAIMVWKDFDIAGKYFKWGAIAPVLILQFFWLYKILRSAFELKKDASVSKQGKVD